MVSLQGARRITGVGTAERDWCASGLLDGLRPLDLATCRAALVVAPHPDDETLAVGGVLARLSAARIPTDVVFVTDGERSHPRSTTTSAAVMRRRRVAESRAALGALSNGGAPLAASRLHVPDGRVAEAEDRVGRLLTGHLWPGRWCFATWERDGHPDHEATGRAARAACVATGGRFFAYPVWAWHWARPAELAPPLRHASVVLLPEDAIRRKEAAIAAYRSQIHAIGPGAGDAAVVPPPDLAHFRRPYEVVLA